MNFEASFFFLQENSLETQKKSLEIFRVTSDLGIAALKGHPRVWFTCYCFEMLHL